MHLRPVTKITFEQRPSDAFPNRTKKFVFGFATDYEASDSWTDLNQ
jgi:hypothetical protein